MEESDGGVYRQSSLAKAIAQNYLNLPEDKNLPRRNKPVPYVMLADAAFPLSDHILKLYPFRNMTDAERIFNYRSSRGRRVVENTFGILANRFRIFLTTINLTVEKVQEITLACCVLHNFLKVECSHARMKILMLTTFLSMVSPVRVEIEIKMLAFQFAKSSKIIL